MRASAMFGLLGTLALTAGTVAPARASPATVPDPVGTGGAVQHARTAQGTALAAARAARHGVDWRRCPDTEGLPPAVRCGTVTVPLDYTAPDGETLRLTLSRSRATGPEHERRGPLVSNPGGPGAGSMGFPQLPLIGGEMWRKLHRVHDFVGYAPRGVGRSSPLSCRDPDEPAHAPRRAPARPSAADKERMRLRAAAYARECARRNGPALRHFTTPDNARDLEVIRAALGSGRLTFYGTSWGTYLGAVYATLFPGRVGRMVFDSVVDPRPRSVWYRADLAQAPAFERRWTDWKRWVARHHRVYGLGTTPGEVQHVFDEARRALDRRTSGTAGSAGLTSAALDTGLDDEAWAPQAAALADFHRGDPRPLVRLATSAARTDADEENADAVQHAVQCADAPWPRSWARWNRDYTRLHRTAPLPAWDNARRNLPCAYWHVPAAQPVDVGTSPGVLPPVLLLAATRDAATPYEGALRMRKRLPGASLVTERGAGGHGIADGNRCVDRYVVAYLLDGRTPGPSASCPARPEPEPRRAGGS